MKSNFSKGEHIVWDSGFGYDVGVYSKDEGVTYGSCEVELITGVSQGKIPTAPYRVRPFTEDVIKELNDKYHKNNVFWEYNLLLDRLNVRYAR